MQHSLIHRPVDFDRDFRLLLDGIVSSPDILLAAARQRMSELRQTDHDIRTGQTSLEKRWYTSLIHGKPDYGIYTDDDYLAEAWACWLFYSRDLLKKISAPGSLSPDGIVADLSATGMKTIVDVGCGIGLTTAALTQLFPNARVIGTNVPGCAQYRIAERLGAIYGFTMVDTISKIKEPVDLILASEYFEHFQAPIHHLLEVIHAVHPRAFIIANAFSVISAGHFPVYMIGQTQVPGKSVGRLFNAQLRTCGYQKIETHLWNNRPSYWKHIRVKEV